MAKKIVIHMEVIEEDRTIVMDYETGGQVKMTGDAPFPNEMKYIHHVTAGAMDFVRGRQSSTV